MRNDERVGAMGRQTVCGVAMGEHTLAKVEWGDKQPFLADAILLPGEAYKNNTQTQQTTKRTPIHYKQRQTQHQHGRGKVTPGAEERCDWQY